MIIAIAGTKGGVGKSTIAIGLAVEAMESGKRTLLVDADAQGTCMRWAQLADQRNVRIPTVTAVGDGYHRDGHINALAAGFDITLLDCPPRLGPGLKGAFLVANLVIIPCRASYPDAWGLEDTVEIVREARKLRGGELRAVVLLSGVKPRTSAARSVREVFEGFGLPILRTEIHDRADYQSVLGGGITLRKHAPRGEAAKEMRALFAELQGEDATVTTAH